NTSAATKIVSSDLGKLDVQRHLISGIDCAIAGAATPAAATPSPPAPAVRKNLRRLNPESFVCIEIPASWLGSVYGAAASHGHYGSGFYLSMEGGPNGDRTRRPSCGRPTARCLAASPRPVHRHFGSDGELFRQLVVAKHRA